MVKGGEFAIERISSCYWLLSLLKTVKPESLNQCLNLWVKQMLLEERKGRTLAVDGKAVRSADGKKGFQQPLHIVSAQLSKLGVLASKSVDGSAMKSQRCRNVAAYGYCGMPGCGRRSELSK